MRKLIDDEKFLPEPPSLLRSFLSFISVITMLAFLVFCIKRCQKEETPRKFDEPSYHVEEQLHFNEVRLNEGTDKEIWVIVWTK